MNRISTIFGFMALAIACSRPVEVRISNPLDFDRAGEIVEVPAGKVKVKAGGFVVLDSAGKQVAYQLTSDGNLLFQADVKAGGTAVYTIRKGVPEPFDTLACGSYRPDRMDDFIWENDFSGYRTYGPALEKSGERAYGYDVFTKSVKTPVMKKRFDAAIYGVPKVNFHLDHGDGMDSYGVGPTLGDGTTAIVSADSLVYPWCWTSYEVLDNGPLRFRARFTYSPVTVGKDTVIETRIITSDAGSLLNRAEVSYSGLADSLRIAAGIVVHKENPEAYVLGEDYAGYADLGDRNIGENGEIFCGMAFASKPLSLGFVPLGHEGGTAIGHVLATFPSSGGKLDYWFGSGWSKAGIKGLQDWEERLDRFAQTVRKPLEVKVK